MTSTNLTKRCAIGILAAGALCAPFAVAAPPALAAPAAASISSFPEEQPASLTGRIVLSDRPADSADRYDQLRVWVRTSWQPYNPWEWTTVNSDGTFAFPDLPGDSGEWSIAVEDGSEQYVDTWYDGTDGIASRETAVWTPLAPGQSVSLNTITLQRAAEISGRVTTSITPNTDDASSLYAQAVPVDGDRFAGGAGATVDADGSFTLRGVAAGTYKVRFSGSEDAGFATTWLGGDSEDTATVLTVGSGEHLGGITADVPLAATISGKVTGPNGEPFYDTSGSRAIDVYTLDGRRVAGAGGWLNPDGSYTLTQIPPGTYRINFYYLGNYSDHWHGGNSQESSGVPVTVKAGENLTGLTDSLQWTDTPESPYVQAAPGDATATLTWTNPKPDVAVTYSVLQYGANAYAGSTYLGQVSAGPGETVSYTVKNLTNGSPYIFNVTSYSGDGYESAWSKSVMPKSTPAPVPPAPPAPPTPDVPIAPVVPRADQRPIKTTAATAKTWHRYALAKKTTSGQAVTWTVKNGHGVSIKNGKLITNGYRGRIKLIAAAPGSTTANPMKIVMFVTIR